MLQISLLGSQWRAFRGRKWNPLKQRVDSYEIEGGHMSLIRVLTAVIFTLVIFLLPTTTVYYLVFVSVSISQCFDCIFFAYCLSSFIFLIPFISFHYCNEWNALINPWETGLNRSYIIIASSVVYIHKEIFSSDMI